MDYQTISYLNECSLDDLGINESSSKEEVLKACKKWAEEYEEDSETVFNIISTREDI